MRTLKATLLLLTLSVPLWAANHPEKHPGKDPDKHDSVTVPEGGEAATYMLVSVGALIGGVLVLRKRRVLSNGSKEID
jgi:hypothetical protein